MTSITRWDPYRELTAMRQLIDRFFEDDFTRFPSLWERRPETIPLALDVAEKDDAFIIKASLPGVPAEDVEVTLTDNVLTIKGEVKEDKEIKEENYHLRERRFGTFMRSVTLPAPVDADKIEAVNENGVLTLTLPKAESVKPKRIEVKKVVNS
ncbi:Hsp20/alpha crystallin family protein [Caldilinea sp.]|jgi:HSP20 family protein|uniref:Hsp20/alpha crystallin family protein n=1 Tax=Caldilinea sp. TaxID=2293560 RepID=UPI0021DD55DE|nr:Hsp20/alpha crystallin family protein [Caldilinea sp.]GIV68513.1 MAG: heat-shock protein Hsp20 [Caldilinea sp.]